MLNANTNLNIAVPNLTKTNCVKLLPLGIILLILLPKKYIAKNGKACPKEYPIIAPNPPHVAASDGPISIHTPKQDATNDAVKDFLLIVLSAFRYDFIVLFSLEKKIPIVAKAKEVNIKNINVVDWLMYASFIFSLRCNYTTGSLGIFSAIKHPRI